MMLLNEVDIACSINCLLHDCTLWDITNFFTHFNFLFLNADTACHYKMLEKRLTCRVFSYRKS